MSVVMPPAASDAEPLPADLDVLRVQSHAAGVPLATCASLAVAGLLLMLLPATRGPHLLAWGLVLVAAVGWRVLLWRRWLHSPGASAGLLGDFRRSAAAHGLAWGMAAWLPAILADAQQQATLVFVLAGLVVGAMAVTLFDRTAALLFGAGVLLPLALRLALADVPLQPASVVACVMGTALLGLLALASRQSDRERRSLVDAQRAERASARGARDAQALLRQVFDHAGLGISVFDRELRLVAWSSQVPALTGLDPARLQVGVSAETVVRDMLAHGQILPAPDPARIEAEVARRLALMREPTAGTSQVSRPDGRLIEIRRNPLPDGGFVMFHTDITQREASRRAAEEQQHMLALVLERTEQGFWYIDNALRTTDANPAMCRLLGLSRDELLGRTIYEFVDDANRAVFEENVARRAAGQASSYEITLTAADGRQVHCFNNATPVYDSAGRKRGALGLFSDISAQKAAMEQARLAGEALAQKSNVLAWTLDSLAQGVLNVDPQGRCTAWNQRFVELLQIPADLLAQRPLLTDLLDWQLAQGEFGQQFELMDQAGRDNVQRAQAGLPQPQGHVYRRQRRDGTVLDIASHFAVDGSLVRTYTDVTASVRAEAALIAARDEAERARVEAERARAEAERAREEAEAANRAKSEFLSRMSHELRTPLNAILGFAQLLQAGADEAPGAQRQQWLDAQMRGGHHLLALINDVLDVARIEGGQLQLVLAPVDLPQVVHEALALVQPMAQLRGVALLPPLLPGPGDWRVQADATRLRQVLLNLLSNAIKFNRDAGQVRLQVSASDGGMLRLEVADQGAGITPQQLPRLFQAFERLDMDGAVEGTGIGLALSRSLVTLMHGTIGVHSTPGQGSVFWLELPRATAAPVEPPLLVPPPPAQQATRVHDVLYIEDNEVNQLLMQGMLAHRPSVRLRLADLPEQGLAMALAQRPDLVLLDIQLPGIDGFEVLRRLRGSPQLAHTPVIAVSANAMPADLAMAREAGFDGYLTKPLDMHQLLAAVDGALAAGARVPAPASAPVVGGGPPD